MTEAMVHHVHPKNPDEPYCQTFSYFGPALSGPWSEVTCPACLHRRCVDNADAVGLSMAVVRTANDIVARMQELGHVVFKGQDNINIIGIRAKVGRPNYFDDRIMVIEERHWQGVKEPAWSARDWPATTDPGLHWLHEPMNVKGTAILVPGQYRGAWVMGLHRGKYEALVQDKPVKVWRDRDLDDELDMDGQIDEGLFGINIHRASDAHPSPTVDKWSAGCQVFQSPVDFAEFMMIVNRSAMKFGRRFTYTLLDEW